MRLGIRTRPGVVDSDRSDGIAARNLLGERPFAVVGLVFGMIAAALVLWDTLLVTSAAIGSRCGTWGNGSVLQLPVGALVLFAGYRVRSVDRYRTTVRRCWILYGVLAVLSVLFDKPMIEATMSFLEQFG